MDPEQQKLQETINTQQAELKTLQDKISANQQLSAEEQKKKSDLELSIEDSKKKLELQKTKIEVTSTDFNSKSYLAIIENTQLKSALLTAFGTEEKVKEFSDQIYRTINTFCVQEFADYPEITDDMKKIIVSSTEFAMTETLSKFKGAGDFFATFGGDGTKGSGLQTGTGADALKGLFTSFTTGLSGISKLNPLNNGNEFFKLAQKVQNFTQFLKFRKADVENMAWLKSIYKTKLVLQDNCRDVYDNIYKPETLTKIATITGTTFSVSQEEAALQKIANDAASKMTPAMAEKLKNSLVKAEDLLSKRGTFQDSAESLLSTAQSLLESFSGIPFIGGALGLWVADKIGNRKKSGGGMMNMFLSALGFPGGVPGLHARYINEKLQQTLPDNALVKTMYAAYEAGILSDPGTDNTKAESTYEHFKSLFAKLSDEKKNIIQQKLPPQYKTLASSVMAGLQQADFKIDGSIIAAMEAQFPGKFSLSSNIQKIEKTDSAPERTFLPASAITNKVEFTEHYLAYIIGQLTVPKSARGENEFIKSTTANPNTFALAIFGNLAVDKFFVEGVNLGIVSVDAYKAQQAVTAEQTSSNPDAQLAVTPMLLDENDPELQKLATDVELQKQTIFGENQKFVQYLSGLEAKNGLAQGIMLHLMRAESYGGKMYGADGKILGSTAGAQGLFQFMPDAAKMYITKIGYPQDQYEKIFTNPLIGAQACAAFLTDLKTKGDDAVTMLAHYNRGPNRLDGKKITADNFDALPWETKNYVVKIGFAMLTAAGLPTVIQQSAMVNVGAIPRATLEQFFTAVNAIPVRSIDNEPLLVESGKERETFKDKSIFMGDSLTVGYAELLGYKVDGGKDANGRYLLGGKQTSWMLGRFDKLLDKYPEATSLTLLGGANDICSLRTPESIINNLRAMSDRAKARGLQVIVGTMPPLKKGLEGFVRAGTWTEAQKETALKNQERTNMLIKQTFPNEYVDFYKLLDDSNKPGYLIHQEPGDGIHPIGADYQKMNDLVFEKWKTMQAPVLV